MSYGIDLLIALLCALIAPLMIMQIKTTIKYSRYIGPDDQPIPAADAAHLDLSDPDCDVGIEVFATKSASCPVPEGEGWIREDDQPPTVSSYVNAAFGISLAIAAAALVFASFLPTVPIAWFVFAAIAMAFLCDLPRLARLFAAGQFGLLVFIPQAFMALGLFAAYRLL